MAGVEGYWLKLSMLARSGKRKSSKSDDLELFPWLGRKNLFQTFEQQDEVEIEQEIKEIRELLDEGGD